MKSNSSRRGFLGAWLAGGALTVLPAASAASSSPDIPPGIFNVREFGAVADGQTVTPSLCNQPSMRRRGPGERSTSRPGSICPEHCFSKVMCH